MTLLATLIARDLRADPADPHWPDRDRLILAAPDPAAPADAQWRNAPPGLALGAAVGQAIAERLLAARFGRSLVDHRIWLAAGQADLVCGTGREAAHAAGALGLGRLAVLATLKRDDKALSASFAASAWAVRTIDAGDTQAAEAALSACQRAHKPTLILAIGAETLPDAPLPPNPRGAAARRAWLKRLRRHAGREAFQNALTGHLPPGWQKACHTDTPPSPQPSTTAALIAALIRLAPILPDLATLPLSEAPLLPPPHVTAFPAGALAWDALDLAAPACLLGMSLHGGIVPLSQTPDSVALPRAAWRMAARLGVRWLHTIVHAQPAPPLPDLAIANLHVFQPADPAEALDCLALALRRPDGPSVISLPSDAAPRPPASPRLCARGAYLVHAPPNRDLTLLAAGPALAVAATVRTLLASHGLAASLVSMPCRALWDAQDLAYRQTVLGSAPIVAFAADVLAFAGLIGLRDLIIGGDSWPPDPHAAAAAILRHRRGT